MELFENDMEQSFDGMDNIDSLVDTYGSLKMCLTDMMSFIQNFAHKDIFIYFMKICHEIESKVTTIIVSEDDGDKIETVINNAEGKPHPKNNYRNLNWLFSHCKAFSTMTINEIKQEHLIYHKTINKSDKEKKFIKIKKIIFVFVCHPITSAIQY